MVELVGNYCHFSVLIKLCQWSARLYCCCCLIEALVFRFTYAVGSSSVVETCWSLCLMQKFQLYTFNIAMQIPWWSVLWLILFLLYMADLLWLVENIGLHLSADDRQKHVAQLWQRDRASSVNDFRGVNLRLNYRLKGYFSRYCDMTQFTPTHHMVINPFLLLSLAAEYRSRRLIQSTLPLTIRCLCHSPAN